MIIFQLQKYQLTYNIMLSSICGRNLPFFRIFLAGKYNFDFVSIPLAGMLPLVDVDGSYLLPAEVTSTFDWCVPL